jgi:hypothetical protein
MKQFARIDRYVKDEATKDIILHANITDEMGKPIGGEVEVSLSKDALQKLIREEMPTEDKRIQELLDKIHGIRTERVLSVEKIDGRIEELHKNVSDAFNACKDKLDIMKVHNSYKIEIALLTQKRHIARFSIQEESDLSLQLAKLRAKTNDKDD